MAVTGLALLDISSLIFIHVIHHILDSFDASYLTAPQSDKNSLGGSAFAGQARRLWNNLQLHIQVSNSVDALKFRVKSLLFSIHKELSRFYQLGPKSSTVSLLITQPTFVDPIVDIQRDLCF